MSRSSCCTGRAGAPTISSTRASTPLKKEYRILALDARAHGQSGRPREVARYGLEMVEDVVRLLDRLKIPRAHVLGFSMGARITAKLMVTHPERLQSVLLVGGGARRDTLEDRQRLERAGAVGYEKGTILIQAWPADDLPARSRRRAPCPDAYLREHDRHALAALTRGRVQFFVTADELRANEVPAIGIAGSKDGALAELRRTAADKRDMAVRDRRRGSHGRDRPPWNSSAPSEHFSRPIDSANKSRRACRRAKRGHST